MTSKRNPIRREHQAQRAKQALQLRLEGHTFRGIAEQLGVSPATIVADVDKALSDIPKREAEQLRGEEILRLDRLQRGVWQEAINGDIHASQQALRIIDRRAKMLGLDAPQRVELGAQDADLEAVLAKAAALMDARDGS
ncbi:hypothetical protein [Tomitella gaofuii]|uniref:hypothetical protein n=1 Tax=Tomitella gaofuii TaxID=2760083 RepID=UPI0015FDB376|nr:hypothetical protein [Tomitella gaofuii]